MTEAAGSADSRTGRLSPAAAAYERLELPVFYAGTHQVNWLWDGSVDFPLFVSHRRLRLRRTLRPAVTGWALDSGGTPAAPDVSHGFTQFAVAG